LTGVATQRWVLHVDLDQFLAAAELLRHPELTGRPLVVGGDGDPTKRGVVSTASYEARRHGVRSGVPLRTAAKRCPDAVFLPVDKPYYEEISTVVMATLTRTVQEVAARAVVEVLGWDEAFVAADTDDPEAVARTVQLRVREATGLDCSVGIGQNPLQAKLATDFGKPRGVYRLTHETWHEVMGARPTDALWGIGRKTAAKLVALGITTVAELAAADPDELARHFGPATGPWLVRRATGRDPSKVVDTPWLARSRGRQVTYQQDIEDWDDVRRELLALVPVVLADAVAEGRPVTRVVVTVRYPNFRTRSHGRPLPEPGADPAAVEAAALEALAMFDDHRPVRLLGLRAELQV
jgi:nucleotidyltransferase/DNA polymerase involved in DNA repair